MGNKGVAQALREWEKTEYVGNLKNEQKYMRDK